ncbi:anhydro-N-acetylmuramic acid kinase [Salinicola endophyticus]|uniref:Anhydro-N-acetylmuramic acid kinase n=1 Tax=Salinicola endophyticus TaxID=1949083 RepID=A0ABY8FBW7_9GAMM|nr:anhydro-N-acetylmuramic acid kinase [Salinicola endophyticus]WFF40309.1 anhydro-N-acetylmuramic acid kinase [Salinicola endophyticus]
MESGWSLGLMTGTVLDGNIDIAMLRSDGETIDEFGPYELVPYAQDIRPLLAEALEAARAWNFEGPEPAIFRRAEAALTEAQSVAVLDFLARHGFRPEQLGAVGFHGQTVLHRPPVAGRRGATRQLGDGELMARLVGSDVVYDFRSADVESGGQGAPLSAVYHRALLERLGAGADSLVLNLGGVANLSWWDGEPSDQGRLIAFDTGPANAPIDDWVRQHTGAAMDRDGLIAARGQVDEPRLQALLEHPYLAAPYPKSLDRFDFQAEMAAGLALEDGAATLTAFTAAAVDRAMALLPQRPERIVVCGGGRRNPTLMRELAHRTGAEVQLADTVGWRGDAIEAECFAYLAMRSLRGLPLSFPLTTGVAAPQPGGRLARANAPA